MDDQEIQNSIGASWRAIGRVLLLVVLGVVGVVVLGVYLVP